MREHVGEMSGQFRSRGLEQVARDLANDQLSGTGVELRTQFAQGLRRRHQDELVKGFLSGSRVDELGNAACEQLLLVSLGIRSRLHRMTGARTAVESPARSIALEVAG